MPVATSHRASILVLQRTARPPRTTLSPYTTLFRSAGRGGGGTPRDPFRPRRHLAMHVRGRVHKGLPQARGSGGGHPAVQARRRRPLVQVLAPPLGNEMSAGPHYTLYHPRWYRRRVSVWWWLQNRAYTGFVLRELTSVFVAFFAVISLWQLRTLIQGPEAYAHFLARLKTPLFL